MVPILHLLLLSSIFSASLVHAGDSESIDEAIEGSEKSSKDAQMHQADGNILAEHDMLFTKEQWKKLQDLRNGKGPKKRNALRDLQKRWPNAEVPYELSPSAGFSSTDRNRLAEGIDEWNRFSCIKIRPRTRSDRNFITVVNGGGCSSHVGVIRQITDGQKLTLANGCRYRGIIAHEFGHALGFHHEQTRPDRDQYVQILEQNITPKNRFNFDKYNWKMINAYDVPYDYESVMHYGAYAFSQNKQMTIRTLDAKYQKVIGNRYGISFFDIKLINLMYDCNKQCPKKSCPGSGFVGKDCKCWCKGPSKETPAVYCDTQKAVAGGNTIGSTPTRSPTAGEVDNNVHCAAWAASGECRKNPKYMLVNCRKSCRAAGAL